MIGENIKTEVSLEELRKITWDYNQEEEIIGFYNGVEIRSYLWEAQQCGDVNPLAVTKCNVAEGWIDHVEYEEPFHENLLRSKIKRRTDGSPIIIKVYCKVVMKLLTAEGNDIVTLR